MKLAVSCAYVEDLGKLRQFKLKHGVGALLEGGEQNWKQW